MFLFIPDRMQKKKTTQEQKLKWIKENKIPVHKKLKPSTINRLYSFYHKNPLSTPYSQAYGMQKRMHRYIEKTPEIYKIKTPKGRITTKKYIHQIDKETKKEALDLIPSYVNVDFNRYYPTVKHLRDEMRFVIKPPIKACVANMSKSLKRVSNEVIPLIIDTIKIIVKKRSFFYSGYDIGALCHFDSSDIETEGGVTDPSFYTRVAWIDINNLSLFSDSVFEAIKKGFDKVYDYKGSSVTLFRIDVYISTKWKASQVDMLRR